MTDQRTEATARQVAQQLKPADILQIAEAAGRDIMAVFERGFSVTQKSDDTPVTEADQAASERIVAALNQGWDWPVLSEEAADIDWATRSDWSTYWLVDPLDGTREFIRRSGDFTVNIALIHNHRPVFGLIHAPTTGQSWWGGIAHKACQREKGAEATGISVCALPEQTRDWVELGSRSHRSSAASQFSDLLGEHEIRPRGSSLKMCHIAAGEGHLYIRMGPTSEWDTAAGQAILEAAGGVLVRLPDLTPLRYNTKEELENPWFIAASALDERWTGPLRNWYARTGSDGDTV